MFIKLHAISHRTVDYEISCKLGPHGERPGQPMNKWNVGRGGRKGKMIFPASKLPEQGKCFVFMKLPNSGDYRIISH